MRKNVYRMIESKLADFLCDDCMVSTPHQVEEYRTLYDWLSDGKDYIPFGSFTIKKGESPDMFGKVLEAFDYADTPFKRVAFHCLVEASCGKVKRMPIITGFQKGKRLELRMEL